jgi:ribosomal protein S21
MNKKQKQHQMIYPGAGLGVKVVGSTREDLSFALKTFKKKIKNSEILEKVKDRREFVKSSVTKRMQLINARFFQKLRTEQDKR